MMHFYLVPSPYLIWQRGVESGFSINPWRWRVEQGVGVWILAGLIRGNAESVGPQSNLICYEECQQCGERGIINVFLYIYCFSEMLSL